MNIEETYLNIIRLSNVFYESLIPYIRQLVRFAALPYCYARMVDWKECPISRFQVIKDLLYIFFILKNYPDNYSPCRLWEKDRCEWKYYYGSIYNPFQRGRLRKEVQKKEYGIIFDNKSICYSLCNEKRLPLPLQYGVISPFDDYRSAIRSILKKSPQKKLIIKPVNGKGGRDIIIAYFNKEMVIQDKEKKLLLNEFSLKNCSLIQEYIDQHRALSEISPSTNTIRIVTLLTKDKNVLILGASLRFGIGNSYVDNISSGGIAAGIDIKHGILKSIAYDSKGRTYEAHPTSNIRFKQFQIPFWDEVLELTIKIQLCFPFYKLLGSDIAFTENGPVIIEINGAHDNVGLEQKCGPILKNESVRVAFEEYGLLIN